MNRDVLPVGAVLELLRGALRVHHLFSDIWVTGEVASATVARGNCFFSLADEAGQLRGVLWRAATVRQAHALRPGMQVAVHGYLDIYPGRGELQLVADSVQPAGLGLAALEFERLRSQLEAEGLFDPSRKRPIPASPRCIGVVTSESGAVWHDIQTVLRRRWPLVEVILSPARVQGDGAPESIASAIAALERDGRADVIIVARGGGAPEDLAAFNAETVVRAIFACPVPVVSGVGHETDVTLADFVADLRAATPSAAAELCTPSAATGPARPRLRHAA
ncbi:MAG: exodeoxyribonuclease VII large subunit, partial [Chloroflexota bacterium]